MSQQKQISEKAQTYVEVALAVEVALELGKATLVINDEFWQSGFMGAQTQKEALVAAKTTDTLVCVFNEIASDAMEAIKEPVEVFAFRADCWVKS